MITKLTVGGTDMQLVIASRRMAINRGGGRTPIPEDSVTYLDAVRKVRGPPDWDSPWALWDCWWPARETIPHLP